MAAVAIVVLVLSACSAQRRAGVDAAVDGPPEAPPDHSLPTVVGLRDDTVVAIDADAGDVVDRHAVGSGAELVDLELVRVRGAAVVTRQDGGRSELVVVDLDDGTTRRLAQGERPAATADGSHLAYVRGEEGGDGREVVATTWDGTELAVWPIAETTDETVVVRAIGWSGTGDELVLSVVDAGGPAVLLVPVERGGTLRGAGEEVPPTSVGAVLRAGTFRHPHVVTVAEGCCGQPSERWHVLDVVPHTWAVTEVVTGFEAPVQHLDWTPDGQHLLVTLDDDPTRVVRWHDGVLHDVVDGVTSAEW